MRATQHRTNNKVLTAESQRDPSGKTIDPLAVTLVPMDNGVTATVSFWRPTHEELLALQAGALVAVWTLGTSVPPMSLGVENE